MASIDPLGLWEAVAPVPGSSRSAAFMRAIGVDPATLTLGEALQRLLTLRAALVGDRIEGYAACPACGEGNTVYLGHRDLTAVAVPDGPAAIEVAWGDLRIRVRPLTPQDLADAGRAGDEDAALALLRGRILLEVRCGDDVVAPDDLPEAAWDTLDVELEAVDGLADPQLDLDCQACGKAWSVGLDLSAFLMRELLQIVRTRLAEVAELARTFGWSEAEILSFGDARRQIYLDLAREATL